VDRARDLPGWPNSEASRFIRNGHHDWHVQEMGSGPDLLFIHGAGASTHTWRDVLPDLAGQWRCLALDLPGQGFTRSRSAQRWTLPDMAADIRALCDAQRWRPRAIVAHSAGVAIALAMARDMPDPPAVIGINAALGRFRGVASWLFPLLARVLSLNPLTPTLFTLGGKNIPRARRLIESTGSRLDARGMYLYATLMADRDHVHGTLQMMTNWKIDPLLADLPQISVPVRLITGSGDTSVPPDTSREAAACLPHSSVVSFEGLGHLAHEEAPERVCREISGFLSDEARAG
tara:strand:- start:41360 stop:42229 length:870 start_codon:yes stop_codon:yes gene_type:complete